MPQIQVLPQVRAFGNKLAEALGGAFKNVGEGIAQRRAQSRADAILQRFAPKKTLPPPQNPQGNGEMQDTGPSTGDANLPNAPITAQNQPAAGPPPSDNFKYSDLSPHELIEMEKVIAQGYGKEAAKSFMSTAADRAKLELKEEAEIRKEERVIGLAGAKEFFEKVENDRLRLPDEQLANDMILDAIKSGEIDPWSSAHLAEIAKSFGAPESLTNILQTPGSKEFKTARKNFVANTIKDAFRGTNTKTEINLLEESTAEVGITREGNLASAWGLQAASDIKSERVRLTDELKQKGISPSKIPSTVDKMLAPYIKETKKEYFEAIRSLRKKKNGK